MVVNNIELPEIKTKRMLEFLATLQMGNSVLVVIAEANERIEKSARNIPGVKVLRCEGLNVYDLLHFHQVLFGGAIFALFGGMYYWFPKFTGKLMNDTWGQVNFWLMFVGFNLTFQPMMVAGLMGMPRRVQTYPEGFGWELWNGLATLGAFTIALGVIFLGVQAYEYSHAYADLNLKLTTGAYGSTFFMLTGFHGFHVTVGAIMLSVIYARCLKGHFKPDHHFAFEGVAWYWHFVDVVWLGLFIFVYWL